MSQIRTAPDHEAKSWPPGVPYIIGNEGCERFSYYGMRSILQVHLAMLFAVQMGLDETDEAAGARATAVLHLFYAGVYALPMIGALLADRLFGKYNVIFWLSLVYCAGHGVLAVAENSLGGMYLGLGLIAVGSGGIKPCVSANVGDQFGRGNWHLVERVFQAFYWIINVGSFSATLLIPFLREKYGPGVAFGVPGILMFAATVMFWAGRKKFVHVPPQPGGTVGLLDVFAGSLFFLPMALIILGTEWIWVGVSVPLSVIAGGLVFRARLKAQPDDGFLAVLSHAVAAKFRGESKGGFWKASEARFGPEAAEGPKAVLRIMVVFSMVSIFWALYDQHSTTWVRQAQLMDLDLFGLKITPSQIQAANPALVMALIPFCAFLLYPWITKLGFAMTPLRRMSCGMLLTAASFAWIATLHARIEASPEASVNIAWQLPAWFLLTLGEVMVSVTGLEFAYTQAPKRMKSTIMGFWLLTISIGNVLVSFLAGFEELSLATSFWMYTYMMLGAFVVFAVLAYFYKGRVYTQ